VKLGMLVFDLGSSVYRNRTELDAALSTVRLF